MMREKLSYQSGESDQSIVSLKVSYLKELGKWVLGYGIIVSLFMLIKNYFVGIQYPSVFIDTAILLIFLASMLVIVANMGRSRIGYPGAVVVNDEGIRGDLNFSRKRAYKQNSYLGLAVGYFCGILLIMSYLLVSII